jgi:hypothetical protein
MKNVVDVPTIEGLTYILMQQFETRFVAEVREVGQPSCKKVVGHHNRVAFCEQSVAKVGADEASSARD